MLGKTHGAGGSVRLSLLAMSLCTLLCCQVGNSSDGTDQLAASFTVSPVAPVAGQSIQFTDTSKGRPVSWQWDFGDGGTSDVQSPVHVYTEAGSYYVELTVANAKTSKSTTVKISIGTGFEACYVAVDDPNAADTNPGTEALPWKTIAKANRTLVAGDTVYIKAGTYADYIVPVNSGTATDPIIYSSYGADVVTVQNASYGILLNGKSYITVQGIDFYNLDRFLYLENGADHNTISHCNFDTMRNKSEWAGSRICEDSSYNWIHHCRFSGYGICSGTPPSGDDSGVVLEIGNEESMTDIPQDPDNSDHNLVENNTLYHGGHHVLGVMGRFNVIRNNYLHNEAWSNGRGNRTLYMNGYAVDTGWNLIERNRFAYSAPPCDDVSVSGVQVTSQHNIFRSNCFYFNDLAGLQFSETSSYYQDILYNHVYNNTFFRNGQTSQSGSGKCGVYLAVWSGPHLIKYNVFKNNIYYGQSSAYGVDGASLADQTFADEYDGARSGDPRFVSASSTKGDPLDAEYPDFDLDTDSPGIDGGGPLTVITSAPGSGTSFTVADAGYFMDGWGISGVEGDRVQLLGTSQTARIIRVDYDTNTITVDVALSWTVNQGLCLAYSGSAPDAGAFESNGGEAAAAYAGKK